MAASRRRVRDRALEALACLPATRSQLMAMAATSMHPARRGFRSATASWGLPLETRQASEPPTSAELSDDIDTTMAACMAE